MKSIAPRRHADFVFVAFAAISLSGCESEKHDTPEDVFDAAKTCIAMKDWKGLCKTLTPESRDQLAVGMAAAGVTIQDFAPGLSGDDAAKSIEKISEALTKHGLTAEHIKILREEKPASTQEAVKKMLAPIKDRDGFIADMMAALESYGERWDRPKLMAADTKLKDVKVEGDAATGTMETVADGKPVLRSVAFNKIDGQWRIQLMDSEN